MCVGPSMLPTFNTAGDVVILDRTSQWLRGEGGKQRTVRELCPPGSVVPIPASCLSGTKKKKALSGSRAAHNVSTRTQPQRGFWE